jgi:hypothetical protein
MSAVCASVAFRTSFLNKKKASNSCVVFRLLEKSFRKSYPKTAKKNLINFLPIQTIFLLEKLPFNLILMKSRNSVDFIANILISILQNPRDFLLKSLL